MSRADLSEDEVKKIDVEKLSGQQRPSLVINAVSNWGPLAVNFVIGFLLTPYLIAHLGKDTKSWHFSHFFS